jgi:O-antigen ligase
MKTAKSAKQLNKNHVEFSLIEWAVILGICLFFIIFPYQAGLFNGKGINLEGRIYSALLYLSILMGFASFFLFRKWRIDTIPSLLSGAVFLLPLCYFISSFQAVTANSAIIATQIYVILASFFVFGLYFSWKRIPGLIFEYILVFSTYAVVVFGLFNMFGQTYYPDALWFTSGSYRLTSVFQYSNTYAGFLSAVFLAALYLSVKSKRWYWLVIHSCMLVPIAISFMLTLSRGALVVLPILLLIIILFLSIQHQVLFALYFVVAAVSTFIFLGKISEIYNKIALIVQPQPQPQTDQSLPPDPASPISIWSNLPLEGWALLLCASLITVAAIYAIHRWLQPWLENKVKGISGLKFVPLLVPGTLMAIGVIALLILFNSSSVRGMLPGNIADRLENINFHQHSVLERQTFYKDALKVVRDYPIIGTGGGGWSAIYQEYQNNPYISAQTHSFYVQILVEIGLVGFLLLLFLLSCIYYIYIRQYFKKKETIGNSFIFFIFATAILIHSLIDFDMSYVYLASLVFFCLGAMLAPFRNELLLSFKWVPFKQGVWRFFFPSIFALLSLILIISSIRAYNANQGYRQAVYLAGTERKELKESLVPLNSAIELSKKNPAYTLTKVDWLSQSFQQTGDTSYLLSAKELIDRLKRYEPYSNELILAQYRNLKSLGEYKEAIAVLEEGIVKFQWDIKFYEAVIMEYAVAGRQNMKADPQLSDRYWSRAFELYNNVLKRMDQLKNLPPEQMQGRMFDVTPFMRQALGQIYYDKKEFQQAITLLDPLQQMDFSDPNVRSGIRYYLASQNAIGQHNETLYSRLIEADPQEKIGFEKLINGD